MKGSRRSKRLARAPTVGGIYVQYICDEEVCRCVGRRTKWMECNCVCVGFARCKSCWAPMHKIHMDTGEPVLEHCLDLS